MSSSPGLGALAYRLAFKSGGGGVARGTAAAVRILHGDEIFGDGPYPHSMTDFIGQDTARLQLLTAMRGAQLRGEAMPHVLLASGHAGIGKTTLAKLTAYMLGVGYVEVGGNVTVKDVRPVLEAMHDHDVLFLDEIHRLVSVKKANAEWLLQLLTDHTLVLPTGVVSIADITVFGATTDAQRLPRTILDRFLIQPVLTAYEPQEAVEIAKVTAKRLNMTVSEADYHRIAAAGDYNPRLIGRLLAQVRDIQLAGPDATSDVVTTALTWTGLTPDGLDRTAQDYLMMLLGYGGTAAVGTMRALLAEAALDQTERTLMQRGFIQITGRGRELTTLGLDRARELVAAYAPKED